MFKHYLIGFEKQLEGLDKNPTNIKKHLKKLQVISEIFNEYLIFFYKYSLRLHLAFFMILSEILLLTSDKLMLVSDKLILVTDRIFESRHPTTLHNY